MTIDLSSDLTAVIVERAKALNTTPEALAQKALRDKFLPKLPFEPQDEWERNLFSAAIDCGVSLSDWALSSDGLYD